MSETFEEWLATKTDIKEGDNPYKDLCIRRMKDPWSHQQQKIDKLERDNEVLKEACEFYGNIENYQNDYKGRKPVSGMRKAQLRRIRAYDCNDNGSISYGGKRARQALSKIRGEGDE